MHRTPLQLSSFNFFVAYLVPPIILPQYFRLVQDFCVLKGNPEPNMSFRNELFVYPSKVFFHSNKIGKCLTPPPPCCSLPFWSMSFLQHTHDTSPLLPLGCPASTRNVAIRVQLREYTNSETGFTEEPIYSDGIPCILGQSVEGIVLHEAYTQVTYHSQSVPRPPPSACMIIVSAHHTGNLEGNDEHSNPIWILPHRSPPGLFG